MTKNMATFVHTYFKALYGLIATLNQAQDEKEKEQISTFLTIFVNTSYQLFPFRLKKRMLKYITTINEFSNEAIHEPVTTVRLFYDMHYWLVQMIAPEEGMVYDEHPEMTYRVQTQIDWAHPLWDLIHFLALRYEAVEEQYKDAYYQNYIQMALSLRALIPCNECREHYAENLKTYNIMGSKYKNDLFQWSYDVHKSVTTRNGKSTQNVSVYRTHYAHNFVGY